MSSAWKSIVIGIDDIATHILKGVFSERGYSGLFKGGVVLLGVALLAMSQVGTFLYDKDLAAHKAKYTLEMSVNQKIEDIDCNRLGKLQLYCKVTKHEMEAFHSSLKLLQMVTLIAMWSGVILCGFSLLGFLFSPVVNKPKK